MSGDFIELERNAFSYLLYFFSYEVLKQHSSNQSGSGLVQDEAIGGVLKHEVKDEVEEFNTGVSDHYSIGGCGTILTFLCRYVCASQILTQDFSTDSHPTSSQNMLEVYKAIYFEQIVKKVSKSVL